MEVPNPKVFRAYDIRGIWGVDFDASFAQRMAGRVAAYLRHGVIIIGRDGRDSSDELAYAMIDGALHTGCRVIDIGRVSTPQMAWAVRELKAAGGLMATASHNPGEYNGIKAIARRGSGVELIGGHHLRQIYDSHGHGHRRDGVVDIHDIIPAYAYAVASAAGWRGQEIQVAVDAPEPVYKALGYIGPIAPHDELAVRFDADGDRIVFSRNGRAVDAEWIFLLLAEHLMLDPVVLDLRFSKAVAERLAERGAEYYRSPVGRLAMTETMRRTGSWLGGEMSGHYYWHSFANMESPELVLLNTIRIVGKSGLTLDNLIAAYPRYFKSDELNIPAKDLKTASRALEHVAGAYSGKSIDRLDGITVDDWEKGGWWFNLRPSNTEPLLRLVAEAKEKDLLESKLAEVKVLLKV